VQDWMMSLLVDLPYYRTLKQYHQDWTPYVLAVRPWVSYGLLPLVAGLLFVWCFPAE
jgi:hypothetical protein